MQDAYIKNSGNFQQDGFGYRVALSGNYLLCSQSPVQSGAPCYLFRRGPGGWIEESNFDNTEGDGEDFGNSIALDGDTAIIGAVGDDYYIINGDVFTPNTHTDIGAAHIFKLILPFEIKYYSKDKFNHTINFTGESGLSGWKVKGGTDMTFLIDHTPSSTITEPFLGHYQAIVPITDPNLNKYFLRIEKN